MINLINFSFHWVMSHIHLSIILQSEWLKIQFTASCKLNLYRKFVCLRCQYFQTTTKALSFEIAIHVMAWKYWADISGKSMSVCEKVFAVLFITPYSVEYFRFLAMGAYKTCREQRVRTYVSTRAIFATLFPFSISFLMYVRYGISLENRVQIETKITIKCSWNCVTVIRNSQYLLKIYHVMPLKSLSYTYSIDKNTIF